MKQNRKERGVIGRTWDITVRRIKRLYLVQLIYIMAVFLILKPFYTFIITGLLRQKGYSYLTSELMLPFFTNPFVIAVILCLIFLMCIVYGGLYVFTHQYINEVHWKGKKKGIVVLRYAGNSFVSGMREQPIRFVIMLMGRVLFQNIPVIVLACRFIPTIWYIVEAFLNQSYVKEGLIGAVLLMLIYFFRNYFTIAYMFFERSTFREAKEKSHSLWRQKHWRAIGYWLFWNVFMTMFTILFYFVISLVSAVIIVIFVPKVLKIAVFCTVQEHLYFITLVASLILGTTLQVVGDIELFYSYKKEVEEDIVQEEEAEIKNTMFQNKTIVAIMCIVLCMDIVMIYDQIQNGGNVTFEHFGQITISSHRGNSYDAPENTMPAIEKAIETTADYVEVDVQETKDGELVLMHDMNVYRTTGVRKKVSELTYEEILGLDAGSWFSSEYQNTPVPTLREVLELCKGKIKLNIEIKADESMPDLEQKVAELIEEYDLTRQCVVTSVYKDSLKKIKKYNKDIMTGYILSSAYGRYYLDKEIDFLSMRSNIVNERVIRIAHKNGKDVCVWTVNSKREAIRMSQLGVDNIITDRPSYIRQVLYEESENSSLVTIFKMFFS